MDGPKQVVYSVVLLTGEDDSMPIVTLRDVLPIAQAKGCAVGSFNAADFSMADAILETCIKENVPVILSLAEVHYRYFDLADFLSYLRTKAARLSIPVVLHLDHGTSLSVIKEGLEQGFSSVMIDGSALPYEENVALTKAAVQEAARFGASVEAELGHVAGGEGNLTEGTAANPDDFTDPNEAARFVEETGVDALAVAIGTVHGPYQGEPRLELDLLSQIREAVSVPLVLHGGSGLSPDDFRQAIARGIAKVNFFTENSLAAVQAIRGLLALGKPVGYPDLITAAQASVQEVVARQIEIFGTKKMAE